jgi:hypothetical protein
MSDLRMGEYAATALEKRRRGRHIHTLLGTFKIKSVVTSLTVS